MDLRNYTDVHPPLAATREPNCTLDTSFRFTYYQVSYGAIFVLGLVGNAVAMRRLWLGPRTLTSSTAIYMANLAVADLFFVISLPLRIYYYHHMATYSLSSSSMSTWPSSSTAQTNASSPSPSLLPSSASGLAQDWSPGSAFCQLTFTLKYISLYGGIFFLVCIGVDRYFAVVRPLSPELRRVGTARLVSVGIWCLVLALSLALPLLVSAAGGSRDDGTRHQHQPCLLDPSARHNRVFILAALALVQVAFLLPALLLLLSYCSVLRVLRQQPRRRSQPPSNQPQGALRPHHHHQQQQQSQSAHQRRHRRTLTVIYWVLGVFLLCFTPYHLNLLAYTLTHVGLLKSCLVAKASKALHPVVLSLASANCCLNPLIYYVFSGLAQRHTPAGTISSKCSGSQ